MKVILKSFSVFLPDIVAGEIELEFISKPPEKDIQAVVIVRGAKELIEIIRKWLQEEDDQGVQFFDKKPNHQELLRSILVALVAGKYTSYKDPKKFKKAYKNCVKYLSALIIYGEKSFKIIFNLNDRGIDHYKGKQVENFFEHFFS